MGIPVIDITTLPETIWLAWQNIGTLILIVTPLSILWYQVSQQGFRAD